MFVSQQSKASMQWNGSGSMSEPVLSPTEFGKSVADRLVELAKTPSDVHLKWIEEAFTNVLSSNQIAYGDVTRELRRNHVHVSGNENYVFFPNDVEVEVGETKLHTDGTHDATVTVNGLNHDQLLRQQVEDAYPDWHERIRHRMADRYPELTQSPTDHILESWLLKAKTDLEIDLEHAVLFGDPVHFAKAAKSTMSLQNEVDQKEVFRDVSNDLHIQINLSPVGIDVCPASGESGIRVKPDGNFYTVKLAENTEGDRVEGENGHQRKVMTDSLGFSRDHTAASAENATQVLQRIVEGSIDSSGL
jgi:hypothetical protein